MSAVNPAGTHSSSPITVKSSITFCPPYEKLIIHVVSIKLFLYLINERDFPSLVYLVIIHSFDDLIAKFETQFNLMQPVV